MAKQKTVVFYPHTARIYIGEYEHLGPEPVVYDPSSTPQGVPLEYWKLVDGKIIEMSEDEKILRDALLQRLPHNTIIPAPIQEIKPHVCDVSLEQVEKICSNKVSEAKHQLIQQVSDVEGCIYEHLKTYRTIMYKDFNELKQKRKRDYVIITTIYVIIHVLLRLILG